MKEPQLYWSGKNDARRLAENDLCCTLHPAMPDADSLPKCRHLFLIGDNLTGLCFLERNSAPRADLIYIDPPYQAYDTTAAQWLSEIYLRLTLARVRMRPEALICISINDRFQAELRLLCNEIFGSQNFVAQIVRKRTDIPPRTSRVVQRIHEYVLVFAKDIKQYLAIHTGPPVPTLLIFCLSDFSLCLGNQSGQHLLREGALPFQTFQHFILIALLLVLGCLDFLLGSLLFSIMVCFLLTNLLLDALIIRLALNLAEQFIGVSKHNSVYPLCQIK